MVKSVSTVNDFAAEFDVSRTKAYELINSGEIKIIRIGRSIRIPRSSIEEWIQRKMLSTNENTSIN